MGKSMSPQIYFKRALFPGVPRGIANDRPWGGKGLFYEGFDTAVEGGATILCVAEKEETGGKKTCVEGGGGKGDRFWEGRAAPNLIGGEECRIPPDH